RRPRAGSTACCRRTAAPSGLRCSHCSTACQPGRRCCTSARRCRAGTRSRHSRARRTSVSPRGSSTCCPACAAPRCTRARCSRSPPSCGTAWDAIRCARGIRVLRRCGRPAPTRRRSWWRRCAPTWTISWHSSSASWTLTRARARPPLDLTLEQRLLRFLAREEDGERRSHRELQAQPVEVRVLEGECIQHARYLGRDGMALRFHAAENTSKFRSGDAVLVGDGHDFVAGVPLVYAAY